MGQPPVGTVLARMNTRTDGTQELRILVVVDDPVAMRTLVDTLTRAGHHVVSASTAADAQRRASQDEPALAITDRVLPDGDGLELLASLHAAWPALPAIIVADTLEPRSIVEAMRRGAVDYLVKPIDPEALLSACRAAAAHRPAPAGLAAHPAAELPIVGVSLETARIRETVARLARTRVAAVLIVGPAGSGRHRVAFSLHAASRHHAPCVPYPCREAHEPVTALSGTPGVEGSGLLAATQGGTLILDDVERLDGEAQATLLAWCDSHRAATAPLVIGLTTDARATGPLVSWLSRARIEVPPLAQRPADIVVLARHFLADAGRRLGKSFTGFTTDAEHRLLAHAWPGNVRELRETIERSAEGAAGFVIRPEQLILGSAAAPVWAPTGSPRPLREIEDAYIDHVIALLGGNKTRAAYLLGISRETLRTRMLARRVRANVDRGRSA